MQDLSSLPQNQPFYDQVAVLSLVELQKLGDKILQDFKDAVKNLEKSSATNEEFLKEVEKVELEMELKSAGLAIMESVHPKRAFRDYSSDFTVQMSEQLTHYNLNQKIYHKWRDNVDPSTLDEQAKYLYKETMDGYKRSGVDQPTEVRNEIKKISKQMSKLATKFSKNISENTPTLVFTKDELAGCFEEFINARLQKDSTVKVFLVTSSVMHIFHNCSVKATREKVRAVSLNDAKEPNWKVLPEFLNLAERSAKLVGYKNFAECSMEDKMIQDPANAAKFIQELLDSTKERVQLELKLIKDFKRKAGDKTTLTYSDIDYYGSQIATRLSSLDEEELKQYFPYSHVKTAILGIFEEMFGLKFNTDPKAKVWAKDVEAFTVEEKGKVIGRIFLDMHPRKGKYNHACSIDVTPGVEGQTIPQNVLLCNFNKPGAGSDGLQSLDEVTTFFHEFGHLIHGQLGGQTVKWSGLSGIKVEIDFAEAPSQLLEEIVMDPQVLKRLTKHIITGEQISDDIIAAIQSKEAIFDKAKLKGLGIARQAALAKESLEAYTTPNITNAKLTKIEQEASIEAMSVYGDYHVLYSFGHLIGYYSNYYTYMWSLAISKDLFTKFNKKNLLDTKVANHYRKTILDPGGSKPASELVKDFLGREWNMDAFRKYLKDGEEVLTRT